MPLKEEKVAAGKRKMSDAEIGAGGDLADCMRATKSTVYLLLYLNGLLLEECILSVASTDAAAEALVDRLIHPPCV